MIYDPKTPHDWKNHELLWVCVPVAALAWVMLHYMDRVITHLAIVKSVLW